MTNYVKFARITPDAKVPTMATEGSAGFDLYANIGGPEAIPNGSSLIVPTGIQVAIPRGMEGQIRSRSGLASNGIVVANSPGTIDSDYRGEIMVILRNQADGWFRIKDGMRIAQIVFSYVPEVTLVEVQDLDDTERGDGGLGSTGLL